MKVKLVNPTSNVEPIELEVGHAERLLRMENNGGWKLPENSPFTFSVENGITKRSNTKDSKKPKEQGTD